MGRLQLDPITADSGPVLAPIELERFAGLEHQRYKRAAPSCLLDTMPVVTPGTGKSGHARIGSRIAQLHQIGVHLLHSTPLFARLACLSQQPCRQTIRIRIKITRPFGHLELRLNSALSQVLLDGIARQASTARYLSNWHSFTQCPTSNDT